MFAITIHGIGESVDARAIQTTWDLVEGESFKVDVWHENLVLAEDEISLREITDSEDLTNYKTTAITANQTEAGRRISLLFGSVENGFIQNSAKLKYRILNNIAEHSKLTLKTAKNTASDADDDRLDVLEILGEQLEGIIESENTAAESINEAANKTDVDAITVFWPVAGP